MIKSQDSKKDRSHYQHHLGRFARGYAEQLKRDKNKRPGSAPAKKTEKSFDEIADLADQDDIPFKRSFAKQRLNSAGAQKIIDR